MTKTEIINNLKANKNVPTAIINKFEKMGELHRIHKRLDFQFLATSIPTTLKQLHNQFGEEQSSLRDGFVNVINIENITITFCSVGWCQTFLKKLVQVCVVVGK
tara:strand:- start:1699 stop:2010 length:312 start_codon:yes stop_codon:yes gene_type:complete